MVVIVEAKAFGTIESQPSNDGATPPSCEAQRAESPPTLPVAALKRSLSTRIRVVAAMTAACVFAVILAAVFLQQQQQQQGGSALRGRRLDEGDDGFDVSDTGTIIIIFFVAILLISAMAVGAMITCGDC